MGRDADQDGSVGIPHHGFDFRWKRGGLSRYRSRGQKRGQDGVEQTVDMVRADRGHQPLFRSYVVVGDDGEGFGQQVADRLGPHAGGAGRAAGEQADPFSNRSSWRARSL